MRHAVASGTSVERATAHDIEILRRTNRRSYETTSRPDKVTVISASPTAVSLRDTQYLTRESVVDHTGHVVSAVPRDTTTYLVLIVRQRDGLWYLSDLRQDRERMKARLTAIHSS